jgi:uncharacterized protein
MMRWLSVWLNSLTAAEVAPLFCCFFVVISFIGIALVHPSMRRMVHGKRQANDVVIFVAANFGLVYAVLLGLLIVATFQITKDLQDHIAMEASSLSTIYSTADAYPEPLRSELRVQLRDYSHYVLDKDWPAHRNARVLTGGDHRLDTIRKELLSFETTDKAQEVLHGEMMRYFNAMNVAREQRLSAVFSSIPDVLWYVLIIGALGTIIFMWMLHMDLVPQLLLSGITAFFLGIMIFLIYALDHPLQGAVSVGAEPFQSVYDLAMKWEDQGGRATFASLGTGELNGIYYPLGRSMCNIIDRHIGENGVRCSPEATPGSVYNVGAIRNGELEFGIVQSDVAYAAYNGTGAFAGKPFRDLRSVLILYPELVTIIARADAGIYQIADLAGRRINVGEQGSGTHATWDVLTDAVDWSNTQRPQTTDLPADAAACALCAGHIDANLLVVGHPSATVRTQLAMCATNFVAVNEPVMDALLARSPYLVEGNISGALYAQTGDTPTVGGNAVLMTSASADANAVAALSQAIITHIDELRTKLPALANLTVEKMTTSKTPAPLYLAANDPSNNLRQSK